MILLTGITIVYILKYIIIKSLWEDQIKVYGA
jgi:hypothetical protein